MGVIQSKKPTNNDEPITEEKDSWGTGINLGNQINTAEASEAYRSITPDGKCFFFHRLMMVILDLYRVDAQFIEGLRPK